MQIFNDTGFPLGFAVERTIPREPRVGFVLKATFDLQPDGVCTIAKTQRPIQSNKPYMDDIGRSLCWANDREVFKPNTDFLVIGSFHQPGGVPAPQGRAGFAFGPLHKELAIFGPRVATEDADGFWHVGAPEPVASVPLRWELSVGAMADRRNPFGKGGDAETGPDGRRRIAMPLIEDPNALLHFPGGQQPKILPPPANFAPLPLMFLERRKKLGTRDRKWTLFRAPLPPHDYDPSHRNAAPHDQQAGNSPRGDEAMALWNMHPKHPKLVIRLPGLRARLAIQRPGDPLPDAEEIAMRLDTVVVLPDEDQLVLLWRGNAQFHKPVPDDDLLGLECVVEPLDVEPETPSLTARLRQHFQEAVDKDAKERKTAHDAGIAQIRKLLSKAKLPPALDTLVKTESDPKILHDALGKFIETAIAGFKQKYPGLDLED